MQEQEKLFQVVRLKESSPLKVALNRGVASLSRAKESHFRPHVCLNEAEGVQVIDRISREPDVADTDFSVNAHLVHFWGDVWLNTYFNVYLDEVSLPNNSVRLSSRQSSYIVQNLPPELQVVVVEKVKAWYLGDLVPRIEKGLKGVLAQFERGEAMAEGVYENHIFDIHGNGQGHDQVPYTEWDIIGEKLFNPIFDGVTFLDRGQDGYQKADQFLTEVADRRSSTANAFLGLMRGR